MPIPYWRHVEYLDDGVDRQQCLMCYETFDIRYIPKMSYCPCCGTKWIGKHEWDEDAKAKHKGWGYRPDRPDPPKRGEYWVESKLDIWQGENDINFWRHEHQIDYGDHRDWWRDRRGGLSAARLGSWKACLEVDDHYVCHYRLMYRSPSGAERVLLTRTKRPKTRSRT